MVPTSETSFFVCLFVFLKKLNSAGLCAEGGETRALHLQPLTPTPTLAARKAVIFNEILLLRCITEVLWQVVLWLFAPQTLLKASVYEHLHLSRQACVLHHNTLTLQDGKSQGNAKSSPPSSLSNV